MPKILHLGLMVSNPLNGFQQALINVASMYRELPTGTTGFNNKALKLAHIFKPDIIFMQIQQADVLNEYTATELSKIGFCINFSGDVRAELPEWYVTTGKIIQLTTFNNLVDVEMAREAGVNNSEYLELGFDPEVYKRWGVKRPCPDIVAHFNDYGPTRFPLSQYRLDIASRLTKEFGNKFGVYGNFPNAKGNLNSNQVEEAQQYNNCKIAINCSHFNYKRYSSDRQLRIMGSGAFCLTHHYDGICMDYHPGKNLDTFNNLDEMVEKCHYYLKHDDIRQKIADDGYDYVRSHFTFQNMAENIVELYKRYN